MTKKPFLRVVTSDFNKARDDSSFVVMPQKLGEPLRISKESIEKVLPHMINASDDARLDFLFFVREKDVYYSDEGAALIAKVGYGCGDAVHDRFTDLILQQTFTMNSGGGFYFEPWHITDHLTPQEWAEMCKRAEAGEIPTASSPLKPEMP